MKSPVEVGQNAIDIPTMRNMSIAEYQTYIESELFFIDHHDVLRSDVGQYPLAVTHEQMKALIEYFKSIESKVGGKSS